MNKKVFPQLGEQYFEQRMENGMMVRVVEKPGFAKKYAFVAVNFGSIDTKFRLNGVDYATPDGVAHYLEHKMFDLPEGNAMELFAQNAGSNNAFTSYAMTAYYVECTEHFEENLSILLRLVTTPYFTEESVEKERGIIAQEIKMYDDSDGNVVQENLFRAMYLHHPARVSVAGTVESIQDITAKTLYDCHRAFYDPSNLILCVVGDVDAAKVLAQAERETPKESVGIAERDYGPAEPMTVAQKRIEARMEVAMPTFAIGFKCEPADEGMEPLRMEFLGSMAAELLAGESSALYTRLYEQGLIDADFAIDYERMKGLAFLEASGDSDDPEAVLAAILEEAKRLAETGIDREQFSRLKKSMLGRRLRELDSFENTCYRICAFYMDGVDYYEYPAAFETVTAEDVEQFLRRVVQEERAAISIVWPKEE